MVVQGIETTMSKDGINGKNGKVTMKAVRKKKNQYAKSNAVFNK